MKYINATAILPDTLVDELQKGDTQTIYLKNVITNANIEVGDYTMYNDFIKFPTKFEQNNVLYHYPVNHNRFIIGKFCSIACGTKFLFNSANHALDSLSTYPFPLFSEEWGLESKNVAENWITKGTLSLATMYGLGLKRLFSQVLRLATEQLSVHTQLSPKMSRPILLSAAFRNLVALILSSK